MEKIRIQSTLRFITAEARELRADSELITEEDDEGRHDDVGQERDDEDLVVEDPVENSANGAEDCVQGRDDSDREVRLKPHRYGWVEQQADRQPYQESEGWNHEVLLCVSSRAVIGWLRRTGLARTSRG